MVVLNQQIPKVSTGSIASYDFTDLATGLGYVRYYGAGGDLGSDYILVTDIIHSSLTYTARSGVGTTTINFDTSTFNLPRTAKGTAIFSCGRFFGTTEDKAVRVTVQKVAADATVTSLSSAISTNNTEVNARMVLLRLPLTQTIIKKGEKLRLKVELVVNVGTGTFEIGHDPKNQNGSSLNLTTYPAVTTVMTFLMPFRVEN